RRGEPARLADRRAVRADGSRGVLPREGRLDARREAHLQRMHGSRRVPRVRAAERRALRHLGRAERARAPQAAPRPHRLTHPPTARRRDPRAVIAGRGEQPNGGPAHSVVGMPRVTAILVVQDGDRWLDGTLAALAAQTRRPDALVVVAEPTTPFAPAALERAGATQAVTATVGSSAVGIARALRAAPPAESGDEWLWLLRADSAPAPDALAALLAAVEVAPSVAVAGPKLVDPDDHSRLRSYGETLSGLGATVTLVDDALDQAQYDTVTDVLAVAVDGAIVRRGVWHAVDGLDHGLPST